MTPPLAPRSSRHFRWLSSVTGDPALLEDLHRRMMAFYSLPELRARYQGLLDRHSDTLEPESPQDRLLRHILELEPKRVVEVGCGNGRLFRALRRAGWSAEYTGIEPAEHLTETNCRRHPDASWVTASAYTIPLPDGAADVVVSVYVIEHLVFAVRGIEEMLRVVSPGGWLVLLFPDFSESGRFGSQLLGFSIDTAQAKLASGRWLDAIVSLYDSRWRLPRALQSAHRSVGPFPVNLAPVCHDWPEQIESDLDAVYIASKQEVAEWARARGLATQFPFGTSGIFREHALLALGKP